MFRFWIEIGHLLMLLFWVLQSNFQHGAEKVKIPDQRRLWSKSKGRHGCCNPGWIVCNHFEQRISWDASEINRFRFISLRDIFFATAIRAAQQLTWYWTNTSTVVWLFIPWWFQNFFAVFFPFWHSWKFKPHKNNSKVLRTVFWTKIAL